MEALIKAIEKTLEDINNGKSRVDYTAKHFKITTYKCGSITRIDIKKMTTFKEHNFLDTEIDEEGDDLLF